LFKMNLFTKILWIFFIDNSWTRLWQNYLQPFHLTWWYRT
jgi:hypothetical protein